jgi:hypothetical protein
MWFSNSCQSLIWFNSRSQRKHLHDQRSITSSETPFRYFIYSIRKIIIVFSFQSTKKLNSNTRRFRSHIAMSFLLNLHTNWPTWLLSDLYLDLSIQRMRRDFLLQKKEFSTTSETSLNDQNAISIIKKIKVIVKVSKS